MRVSLGKCSAPLRNGALAFVAFTFLATWFLAWLLRDVWHLEQLRLSMRILVCSSLYLAVMGWQPMAAVVLVRRHIEGDFALDAGLRGTSAKFLFLGTVVPALAMLVASLVAMTVSHPAIATVPAASSASGVIQGLLAVACVLIACGLIYGQCLAEEVAWRGYFLVRVMGCLGPWRGLVIHGLVWGIWYAPVLVFTGGGVPASWGRAAEFAVTCVLLGVLLGWLRLASRSIVPTLLANVVLTLGAGLPILLGGREVGARGAIYSPFGWLPLLLIAGWLLLTRHRSAVKVPRPARSPLPRPSQALH